MNKIEILSSLDLPSLQSIQLGDYALLGKDNYLCSLTMRSMKEMTINDRCRPSKSNIYPF